MKYGNDFEHPEKDLKVLAVMFLWLVVISFASGIVGYLVWLAGPWAMSTLFATAAVVYFLVYLQRAKFI